MKLNGIYAENTRVRQTGCKFSWTDAATITLAPNGIDSKSQVMIHSIAGALSGSDAQSIELSADLTCALSTAGAGGLDGGSEASDKGYYIFLISPEATKGAPKLLASLSDTAPTMPAGYTYRSRPIWFVSNNGDSDIREFIDVNGHCYYTEVGDAIVLTNGVGYSGWTLVDCSVVAPNNSLMKAYTQNRAKSSSVWSNIKFHTNATDAHDADYYTLKFHNVIRNVNGSPGAHYAFEQPMVAAATSLYYKWGSDPGSGGTYPPLFTMYCRGWTLK